MSVKTTSNPTEGTDKILAKNNVSQYMLQLSL
jgi:hypothetical protein